jgi:hypothetical protein
MLRAASSVFQLRYTRNTKHVEAVKRKLKRGTQFQFILFKYNCCNWLERKLNFFWGGGTLECY